MTNLDKLNLKNEYSHILSQVDKYYSLFTNDDNYQDRIFYLNTCTDETIAMIKCFFPESFQSIRNLILTRVSNYITSHLPKSLHNLYLIKFDESSSDFELSLYKENEVLLKIYPCQKKVVIKENQYFEDILNIKIPNSKKNIEVLEKQSNYEKQKLSEGTFVHTKDYALHIFFPKQFNKKMNKTINTLTAEISFINEKINNYLKELEEYHASKEYIEKKKIADTIYDLLSIKKRGDSLNDA